MLEHATIQYISTGGAHDPRELCKYGYDCQSKGESESRGSHIILTLEQTSRFTMLLFKNCLFLQ